VCEILLPDFGQGEVAWCGENGNEPYLLTYLLTYLINYLFISWSRVFLEKLTGFQLDKTFPAFHETLGRHR